MQDCLRQLRSRPQSTTCDVGELCSPLTVWLPHGTLQNRRVISSHTRTETFLILLEVAQSGKGCPVVVTKIFNLGRVRPLVP